MKNQKINTLLIMLDNGETREISLDFVKFFSCGTAYAYDYTKDEYISSKRFIFQNKPVHTVDMDFSDYISKK